MINKYYRQNSQREKHLVIVFWNMGIGGVQRKILDIVNYIDKEQFSSLKISILLEEKRKLTFIDEIKNKNVEVIFKDDWVKETLKISRSIRFSSFLFIWSFLNKPNIILTFLPRLSIDMALVKNVLFWRDIVLVLSEDFVTSAYLKRESYSFYISKLITFFYSKANSVISISKFARNDLLDNYLSYNIKVILVDNWTEKFDRIPVKRNIDMIYVGRLDKEKKVGSIFDLFKINNNLKKKLTLIVGDGNDLKEIKKLVKENKLKISFKPKTLNVKKYLAKSKIFLSFSRNEGMPITFLEAMSCGTVVVAMHFPGIEELITHKKTGFICKDSIEMNKWINVLLNDSSLLIDVTANAKKLVEKDYSLKNIELYLKELGLK